MKTHICDIFLDPNKEIWPRGHKTVFMLSSDEHGNFSANKYENAN